jgi:predicted GH43/DUF377 family glycosyl hydrolase
MIPVRRTNIRLSPNPARVLFRPFVIGDEGRIRRIISRIAALSEAEVRAEMKKVLADFNGRHQRLSHFFQKRYEQLQGYMPTGAEPSTARRLLIGAYFTMEYALESAALFNPSLVWHPDQTKLKKGAKRFVLSLRAVGEGHLSSLTFRSGIVDTRRNIVLDADSTYVVPPRVVPDPRFLKSLFQRKLTEWKRLTPFATEVLSLLDDEFTLDHITKVVAAVQSAYTARYGATDRSAQDILTLARSNYEVWYTNETDMSERVIFPYAPTEVNGIEDARFVRFTEDDGQICYYATYTAYDGKATLPQILETTDFLHFKVSTLNGPEIQNKGLALFPRKIGGQYAMVSRQDGENLYIMYSEHPHFWYKKEPLIQPLYPWEFVQLGNCGSPIETEAGWLLLTHGVGPMRKYAIGAILLDLENPAKIIGHLAEPLLSPEADEREGYVPNVVYSCGADLYERDLILPYAMSDYASSFAVISLDDILEAMIPNYG